MLIIQIIAGCLLLIGLSLFMRDMRGRKADDHLYCRRCRFDLSGHAGKLTRCPECGLDVMKPRSVRRGRRVRRNHTIAVGCALIVLGGGPLIISLTGDLSQGKFYRYAPEWWLTMEAESGASLGAEAAIAELSRRMIDHAWTERDARRAVEAVLDRQANQLVGWTPAMGDFVERAFKRNLVSDEQWERYLIQGYQVELSTRSRIRAGGGMPIHVDVEYVRYGSATFDVRMSFVSLAVDGEVQSRRAGGYSGGGVSTGNSGSSTILEQSTLDVGEHQLAYALRFTIIPPMGTPASFDQVLKAIVLVVPEDSSLVELRSSLRLDEAIRDAIEVKSVLIMYTNRAADVLQGGTVQSAVDFNDLPIGVAFDVYFRHGSTEWIVGSANGATGSDKVYSVMQNTNDLDPPMPADIETLDVILRSNSQAAEWNPQLEEIWDGELIFENVPIQDW